MSRRDVLGKILDAHDTMTVDRAPGRRRNVLGDAMEVVALVAAEYPSASEMPGARMLADVRQERFTQGIARGMTVVEASRFGGYPGSQSILLENDHILNRIAYHRRLGVEAADVTQERIARELSAIAFANMRDAVEWAGSAIQLKPSETLDDATASAVSEVKQTKEGLSIKMHDKQAALKQLGSHLGMFVERREISGPGGKPITAITSDMDPQKAMEAYMDLVKEN